MSYALTRTSTALDAGIIQALNDLSDKWNVSKAEMLRRALRQLADKADKEQKTMDSLQALDWLQDGGGIVAEAAAAFRADVQAERQEKTYWWES